MTLTRACTLPASCLAVLVLGLSPAEGQPPPPPPPGAGGAPVAAPAPLPARPAPKGAIAVPRGDGTPVITDGIFSAGEWDDALEVRVGNHVTLHLKEWREVVFVGLRGETGSGLGPTELGLSSPGGPVLKLHVSYQLFESVLPAGGGEPPARMGFTEGWYASELRRDEAAADRLRKEGRPPMEAVRASLYPSDGIEFAIRRSKVAGDRWLLRVWASATDASRPGMLGWPAGTDERATAGWAELALARR